MKDIQDQSLLPVLERIAAALEAGCGTGAARPPDWNRAKAWVWQAGPQGLKPVADTGALALGLLVGVEEQAETLLRNTRQFAAGFPANNALLWGARGMGKSSLVKAVHAQASSGKTPLTLIEIHREDMHTLPALLGLLRGAPDRRFLLFCDDLSFESQDSAYKSLKAVLEGGIEGRPDNVIFYATSNRRHLMQRDMIENERGSSIHPGEAVEEKVSLSDRFGLWLGFYPCDQDAYLAMIDNYARALKLPYKKDALHRDALAWAMARGARSGRVAWQFIQDAAGRAKVKTGSP